MRHAHQAVCFDSTYRERERLSCATVCCDVGYTYIQNELPRCFSDCVFICDVYFIWVGALRQQHGSWDVAFGAVSYAFAGQTFLAGKKKLVRSVGAWHWRYGLQTLCRFIRAQTNVCTHSLYGFCANARMPVCLTWRKIVWTSTRTVRCKKTSNRWSALPCDEQGNLFWAWDSVASAIVDDEWGDDDDFFGWFNSMISSPKEKYVAAPGIKCFRFDYASDMVSVLLFQAM